MFTSITSKKSVDFGITTISKICFRMYIRHVTLSFPQIKEQRAYPSLSKSVAAWKRGNSNKDDLFYEACSRPPKVSVIWQNCKFYEPPVELFLRSFSLSELNPFELLRLSASHLDGLTQARISCFVASVCSFLGNAEYLMGTSVVTN